MLLMLAYPSLKDGFLPHLTIYLYLTWNTQYSTGGTQHICTTLHSDCYIWWWLNTSISYLLPSEQPENTKLWETGWWNGKSRRAIKLWENAVNITKIHFPRSKDNFLSLNEHEEILFSTVSYPFPPTTSTKNTQDF